MERVNELFRGKSIYSPMDNIVLVVCYEKFINSFHLNALFGLFDASAC